MYVTYITKHIYFTVTASQTGVASNNKMQSKSDKEVALVTNNVFYTAWNLKLYESSEHVDKVHGRLNSTINTHLLAVSVGMVSSIFCTKPKRSEGIIWSLIIKFTILLKHICQVLVFHKSQIKL